MIVLGPHVLTRSEKACKDIAENCSTDESTQQYDGVRSAAAESDDPLLTTGGASYISSQWEETRIDISRMLGSIGAPPLTALTFAQHDNDIDLSNANNACIDDSLYLDATSHLSASHVNLIKTMDNALNILVSSTSLRLGLGVTHSENERAVFRAEKTRAERHLENDKLNACGRCHPKLTLSRSRQILCQIMIDQAVSLRATLTFDDLEYKKWDEFIDDMQYCYKLNSSQNAPVLTLSKISIWMNDSRGLLCFVLSQLLSQKAVTKDVSYIKQSCQFVRERFEFLQSTFSLSAPTQVDNSFQAPQDDSKMPFNDESARHAMKMMYQLQLTLEAAQHSLLGMRHSFLEDHSKSADSDDTIVWWSQLNDLLSETESAMNHFKSQYLPHKHDDMVEISDEGAQSKLITHTISSGIEIVDDAPDEHLGSCSQTLNSIHKHADKTWVFSASGAYKQGPRPSSTRTGDLLHSTKAFGQTLLIRDLEKRLNKIQLADEHNAVQLDEYNGDMAELKPCERQAVPFFMGVEGSLLSELSNALDASGICDDNK